MNTHKWMAMMALSVSLVAGCIPMPEVEVRDPARTPAPRTEIVRQQPTYQQPAPQPQPTYRQPTTTRRKDTYPARACWSCDGRGWDPCTFCNACGKEICWQCDGKGWWVGEFSGDVYRCNSCGGDGVDACMWCHGRGWDDCMWCVNGWNIR